jgi:hypothetical protein
VFLCRDYYEALCLAIASTASYIFLIHKSVAQIMKWLILFWFRSRNL